MIRARVAGFVRRRSALELAVAVAWAVRAFSGWILALPLVSAFASVGLGALPAGDRALFEPGGLWLLESLRKVGPSLGASASAELVLFALAAVAGVVPHALLFTACAEPGAPFSTALARALGRTPRFVLILVAEAAACAVALGVFAIAAGLWGDSAPAALTEPGRDLSGLGVLALGVAAAAAIGVGADALRAASARDAARRLRDAARDATRALRKGKLSLASGAVLLTGASALLVALAARATDWIDVGKPGVARVLLVFAVHQAVLLGLALFQALWVRRVTAALRTAEPGIGAAGAPLR